MSTCPAPSGRSFALRNLTVQRASVSFRAALAGSAGHISRAVRPSLIAAFSSAPARWRGAETREGVHDPAGPGNVAGLVDRPVQLPEQLVQRVGLDRRLAEVPQRVRVRHLVAQPEPAEAHPARPVARHRLGRGKRQPVKALQHKHLELRHDVQGRAAALRARRLPCGPLEDRPEPLEIHRPGQRLQRVAVRRNLLQPLPDVPKSRLLRHRGLHCR